MSFVDRVAHGNGLERGQFLDLFDLPRPHLLQMGVTLTERAALSQVLRLRPKDVDELTFLSLRGLRLTRDAAQASRARGARRGHSIGISHRRTPVCPLCAAQTPARQLIHQTAWCFMCREHRLLLIDRCPKCMLPISQGGGPGHTKLFEPSPGMCENLIGTRRCAYPFVRLPQISLANAPQAVKASDTLDALVRKGPRDRLDAVKQLICWAAARIEPSVLIAETAEQPVRELLQAEEVTVGDRWHFLAGMPRAVAALMLTRFAAPLLAGDTERLAEQIGPQLSATGAWRDESSALIVRTQNPTIRAAVDLTRSRRYQRNYAVPSRTFYVGKARIRSFGPEHVPQLWPLEQVNTAVVPLLPSPPDDPREMRTLRLYVSVAVLRFCRPCSSHEAGQLLELRTSGASPGFYFRNMAAQVRRNVDACCERFADELEAQSERADYAAIRRTLGSARSLAPDVYRQLAHAANFDPGRKAAPRHAALWLWEHLALGDVQSWPVYETLTSKMVKAYREYRRALTPAMKDELLRHGAETLRAAA